MKFLLVEEYKKEPDYLGEDITLQDKHSVREFADECKVDGLPLMDYKEFSELLNEQGMKPNEELYQVYVDAYNNEEDTDYIGVVRKKFEKMSSNEIIDLLDIPNNTNIDSDSPMFLLPNGSIISVAQAGKLIGQELSDNIHSDMVYVILSAIAKKYNYDWDMDDSWYEDKKLDYLTYGLDWARLNCGETWAEKRFYCVLPNHMTSSQYRSLEKWLEWGADTGKKEVLVYVSSYQDNNTYSFKDNLPEDISKKIKRYYSSGKLYENRNELKENMNNKYRMDNGMIEDDYFTFERDNITYHFFYKPTRRTEKGQYGILAVDYGIRFDKEPYKDERGHTIIPMSRAHDKPQQLAYFEFNEDTHPEIAYAMTEDDRKEYRDLVVAETKKHMNEGLNEDLSSEAVDINQFTFTNYRNPDGQSHPKCKTYRSTLEYMASETERLFNTCLKNYWGETKPYDQLTIEYMNLNRHSCTRDLVGAGAEQGLKDAQSAIFKRQGELLELAKQFTKWNGKEWVKGSMNDNNTITEGLYGYQTFIRTGDRGKPIYTLSYGPNTIVANYDKNSFMITFGSDWKHHIKHLLDWLKEYYPNFFVKQDEGSFIGFIPTEEEAIEYIQNEIRRGKALTESNELEQRAKKHKKKSKGMGWHMSFNAGDVEKGIEVFNNSTSLGADSGEGTSMGEGVDDKTYYYDGPIYYRGHKIAETSDIYTTAKSLNVAIRNVLYKATKGDKENLYQYEIVDHLVKEISRREIPKVRPKCQVCGYELNDIGDCPVCDYGENYLLESLSDLEALWALNNLD